MKGRSGRTGAPVWAVRLDRGRSFTDADAVAAAVRPGSCNDVVVVASGPTTDYAAVLSNQGKLRWSLVGHNGSAGVRTPALAPPSRSLCS